MSSRRCVVCSGAVLQSCVVLTAQRGPYHPILLRSRAVRVSFSALSWVTIAGTWLQGCEPGKDCSTHYRGHTDLFKIFTGRIMEFSPTAFRETYLRNLEHHFSTERRCRHRSLCLRSFYSSSHVASVSPVPPRAWDTLHPREQAQPHTAETQMKAGICGSARLSLYLLESPCCSPGSRVPVFLWPLPAQRNPQGARLHTREQNRTAWGRGPPYSLETLH